MPQAAAATNDSGFVNESHRQDELFRILFGEDSDEAPNAVPADPALGAEAKAVPADLSPDAPSSSKGPRPRPRAPNASNSGWTCERCGRFRPAIYQSCDHCNAPRRLAPAAAQQDSQHEEEEEEEATLRQEDSDTDDDGSWKEAVKEANDEEMRADEMLGLPLVIWGHMYPHTAYREELYGFTWAGYLRFMSVTIIINSFCKFMLGLGWLSS